MKIVSWNVNGIRAAHQKGFMEWLEKETPEILCAQEVKANPLVIQESLVLRAPLNYFSQWAFAQKPGYSGLATFSKKKPDQVIVGLGIEEFDSEGRWLETYFNNSVIVNSYFPNSQREHTRLPYKLRFCEAASHRLNQLRMKNLEVFLCGDLNIAHKEIDLKNPKANIDNAGFLPEERAWMDRFVDKEKWIDCFREFESGPDHYTWWSYRPGVREKNIGWRLDYFFTNSLGRAKVKNSIHLPGVLGSDHCPLRLTLDSL